MNPQIQAADPSITQGEIARLRAMMMAMPLDQLQAYAAQHMNNPNGGIIVGIASQVANAKKGATPQTPPNSVAQQAVQSIAPESQGIGQLPARNLEGMADGGIAGYAGGGDTDKDRYPTHEEAVAAFNAAYPTPKYNQPEQRGPISQAAHDLMVQFHLLPDDTPGTISPESQRASVYGASQIGHAAGGMAGYAEGGQTGGRMDGGIRRFDVAGLVPNQSLLGDIPMYDTTPLLPTQAGAPENNKVPFLRQLYRDYMTRRSDPTNPNNYPSGLAPAQKAPVVSTAPAVTNPTDARLAAGVQQPPGGIADLAAAIPDTDPKTKAPPKVTNAKKEGTVASNGLYDLLDNKGTAYKGLTLDDINRSVSLAQSNAPSATDLYNQANSLAKEKDAAAKAEYKPLQDLSDAEHKRLQNRNDNAFANALIMGLSLIHI